jgi:hypothetical protein
MAFGAVAFCGVWIICFFLYLKLEFQYLLFSAFNARSSAVTALDEHFAMIPICLLCGSPHNRQMAHISQCSSGAVGAD